ncbi:hypothetical protein H8E77_17120 [bacterium]|nr:hypothetical protein [bacterium]
MAKRRYTFHIEPNKIAELEKISRSLFEVPIDTSKQVRAALNMYLSLPDEKKRDLVKREMFGDNMHSVAS